MLRQPESRAAKAHFETRSQRGYRTGDGGAASGVWPWLPLSFAQEGHSGQSRPGLCKQEEAHFRARVLLAWP